MTLTEFRKEYKLGSLRRRDLSENPLTQFNAWFEQAVKADIPEPTAMSLATVDKHGQPSLRTVLLKVVNDRGFIFCTSYESQKGLEIEGNARVALLFLWKELERQICIEGTALKVPTHESEFYFAARPIGSQLGAAASKQSLVVESREVLEKQYAELDARYAGQKIPRPPNWGGYVVAPKTIQFWQGRVNRLHDRFRYTKQPDASWIIERLSP